MAAFIMILITPNIIFGTVISGSVTTHLKSLKQYIYKFMLMFPLEVELRFIGTFSLIILFRQNYLMIWTVLWSKDVDVSQ